MDRAGGQTRGGDGLPPVVENTRIFKFVAPHGQRAEREILGGIPWGEVARDACTKRCMRHAQVLHNPPHAPSHTALP
jgi:hypothetical protein